MALTISGIPDCKAQIGFSQYERGVQLQPGASDYPLGGYVIPNGLGVGANASVVGSFEGEFAYGAWILSSNLAASAYNVGFVLSSGSFGSTPAPGTSLTMIVTLPATAAAEGTPIGVGPVSTVASTAIGVVSDVITVTQPNTLKAGQFVYYQSTGAGAAFAGTILYVTSATAAQWTAVFPTANITAATADITITYQVVQAATGNQLTTGTSATITNSLATTSLLTMTCANAFVPGNFVLIQGLTNGAAANGVIVKVQTASSTQFTAIWTGSSFSTGADSGTAKLLVTAGNAPIVTDVSSTITNSLATASSAGTAGLITLTANNGLVPGNVVLINGLTNGAGINGDLLTVLATSLTNAAFKANYPNAGFTSAADSGTATLIVTGTPTSSPQVAPGTDLSSCTWFARFLTGGE
jgi:hypothetical protein